MILYGSKKTSDFDTIIVGTSVSTVSQTVEVPIVESVETLTDGELRRVYERRYDVFRVVGKF